MNFEEYMNYQNSGDVCDCEWEEDYDDDFCEEKYEPECEEEDPYCPEEPDCEYEEEPPCKCEREEECLEDTVDNSCMSCCRPTYKPLPRMGKVEAFSFLNCVDGEAISGVPFNLYLIEDGCEKLVASKKTDKCGRVEFNCLKNGLYRIQQVVDECVFECPEYFPGREFCITDRTKCQKIVVINKLRQIDRCLKKVIDRAAERAVNRALCRIARARRCC